jgi:hypothetical protein
VVGIGAGAVAPTMRVRVHVGRPARRGPVAARAASSGDVSGESARGRWRRRRSRARPTPTPPPLRPPPAAWARLRAFTAADAAGRSRPLLARAADRASLAAALRTAAGAPWPAAGWDPGARPPAVLIGVLATDDVSAARSLRDYCETLGARYAPPTPRVAGPVFVRYNAATAAASAAPYAGRDRGVLVTLGADQVGHLPLGLLDEARTNPPPLLVGGVGKA